MCGCTTLRMFVFSIPTDRDTPLFCSDTLPVSYNPYRLATAHFAPSEAVDTMFEDLSTTAVIVVRGDSVVYSRYADGYGPDTCCDMFSVTKSFVGALLGIAVGQGYLSPTDLVSKYLPATGARLSDSVRVIDLVNMRAGIGESGYQTALLYYTPNLARNTATAYAEIPLGMFAYASRATQLLGYVIEAATGVPLTDYFIDNYWLPTRAANRGFWSVDSRRHHATRCFCGLCITPSEVVKLGMIYRDGGMLNGCRIVPQEWIERTLNPAVESADRNNSTYNCGWYIVRPDHEFMAQGFLGQILYVNRDTDTVVARFGKERASTDWVAAMQRLAASCINYY